MVHREIGNRQLVAGLAVERGNRLGLLDRDGRVQRPPVGEEDPRQQLEELDGLRRRLDLLNEQPLGSLPVAGVEGAIEIRTRLDARKRCRRRCASFQCPDRCSGTPLPEPEGTGIVGSSACTLAGRESISARANVPTAAPARRFDVVGSSFDRLPLDHRPARAKESASAQKVKRRAPFRAPAVRVPGIAGTVPIGCGFRTRTAPRAASCADR